MIATVQLLSALSDPTRLAALAVLADGQEHCVCALVRLLGATQSRVSRHMAVLKAAGLVSDRRDAQWVRYRSAPNLPAPEAALVKSALGLLAANRRREGQALAGRGRVA